MQIVINIGKKHFYAIMLAVCLLGGGFVIADSASGTGGNPSIMGHSLDEIGGGTMSLGDVDGTSHRGVLVVGTASGGEAIMTVKNLVSSVPGESALEVKGHLTSSTVDGAGCSPDGTSSDGCGDVYFKTTVRYEAPSLTPLPLCIEHNPSDAMNDGRIVVC